MGSTSVAVIFRNNAQAMQSTKNAEAPKSMFEFAGAAGWRKGPSNETSMALFNNQNPSDQAPCFTSTEYYTGTVDAAAELNKSQQSLSKSGYTVTSLGTKALMMQT